MNYRRTFYVFISLFFLSTGIFAQAQLVQSFIEQNNRGDTKFGCSVSTAGDVNNDGYDDVIIGAYGYDEFTGRAYLYYGGNPMNNIADIVMSGENAYDKFGSSVSTAGDINNDGYDDIIVGAFRNNESMGRVYIYYGGNPMNNIADVIMTGENASDSFGRSVSTAGDVNNDGYDDVFIGADGCDDNKGRAYIYFGSSSMNNIADIVMTGENTNDYFGWSVSTAGDINNDGFDDVIVGALRYNDDMGRAYIFCGGSTVDTVADIIMTGENKNDYFGRSVSTTGDVNNDGFDDVIVGASGFNDHMGRAYIFLGGSSVDNLADIIVTGENIGDYFGFSASTAGDVNNDGYNDVIVGASCKYNDNKGFAYLYYGGNPMNDIADVIMTGENANDYFGRSVSTAGDVNNDGFDDVIVGANRYNDYMGRAYIFWGGSSVDNLADIIMTGEGEGNNFGYSVSTTGDVNNDGYDDIIVGAAGYDDKGGAYIYYGGNPMDDVPDVILAGEVSYGYFGKQVAFAGDVNNDGYDDVIVGDSKYNNYTGSAYLYYGGNPMNNTADIVMTGENTYNEFGKSVSAAGDVNNDGFADVVIGASNYNDHEGRTYVYFGSSTMDNIPDVIMSGETSSSQFGYSVSTAGDVNNDGFDDLVVGTYLYNNYTGRAYIYFGGATMDNAPDIILTGETTYSHFGYSVSTAGDVNNDGYDDVIIGTGTNSFNNSPGFAYIFYGSSSMDSSPNVTMTVDPPSDFFGCSVSTAGDINNDGYSDVIVGDYLFDSYTGRAFIYYGSNEMDSIADIIITGEGTYDYFGYSVSNAGDVNNDGYDDVIIGAYQYSENGKAYIYSDPNAPLPVELTAFTAKIINNSVQLNWVTATEINNYGFEIERKKEVINKWQKIGFVEGHGNSNSVNKYSFIDNDIQNGEVQYRLKQIDNDGSFEYSKIFYIEMKLPTQFELEQNYPNPFNPVTTIKYSIPTLEMLHSTSPRGIVVQLKVYDVLGKEVKTLVNEKQNPGNYKVDFNASKLSSGIYFYRLQAGKFVISKKMLLLK